MRYGRVIGQFPCGGGITSLYWFCPGCGESHAVSVGGGARWGWNGDNQRPTIMPSVRAQTHQEPFACFCHCTITDGTITFAEDSTHDLKGKTVPMPLWPYGAGGN